MDKKIKIIALYGKSGSGKDSLSKWLISHLPNSHRIIGCTTRPPRDYEENGKDYFFFSDLAFGEKVLNGQMLEATSFRNWIYGTAIETLEEDKINIGVFNPEGIECLLQDNRLEILPIQIVANDKDRLIRNLKRETNPDCKEICRRFLADEQDFSNIEFSSLQYHNYDKRQFYHIMRTIHESGFLNQE